MSERAPSVQRLQQMLPEAQAPDEAGCAHDPETCVTCRDLLEHHNTDVELFKDGIELLEECPMPDTLRRKVHAYLARLIQRRWPAAVKE